MPPRSIKHSEARPGPGQMAFPDVGEVPIIHDLDRQNVFAQVAMPEYWGMDLEQYAGLESRAISAATTNRLRSSLIGLPRNSKGFVVGYVANPQMDRSPTYIALTPTEFPLVRGSIQSLGETTVAKVLKSRPDKTDFDNNNAAAQRGGVHAVEGKKIAIERYANTVLGPNHTRLARYIESASNPGLQRRKEISVREDVSWILNNIFGDMLLAIRHVRQWRPEQAELAKKAVEYRLFLDRDHNRHLRNWREMLSLALSYNSHKLALFNDKIAQADYYIQTHTPEETDVE
ncbi:hypothetical protein A2917_01855 [Candidatus Nomurabacteria bacterium RIFCSPLOWO2_01_FULL_42_17]|uniref:Uncharacterized protein n=1 Tax=Candidatus Nomurabacteria bacterium RIFCSPLOWO2_01_FULL_42_17 TaxID=1801780 RepID=A0A1F6XM59_9BACT|nr:MAG: hypothetical protein A2917_01855 [Candidatus Nomurabacteria bacterium RIFCSPLOWO2_01_FULL_42_17]